MRNTGIVRKLDSLGRITLPKEIRKTHRIDIDDPVEIYIQGDMIVLKKYSPGCDFCKNMDFIEIDNVKICNDCITKIKNYRGGWR